MWTEKHAGNAIDSLKKDILPHIGKRPINSLITQELLLALRKIESRGALETVGRVRQRCESVFRYAIDGVDARGTRQLTCKGRWRHLLKSISLPWYQ
jgi:hypothetical protein